MQTQALDELHGRHRGDLLEMLMQGRRTHAGKAADGIDIQRLVKVLLDKMHHRRNSVGPGVTGHTVAQQMSAGALQDLVENLPLQYGAQHLPIHRVRERCEQLHETLPQAFGQYTGTDDLQRLLRLGQTPQRFHHQHQLTDNIPINRQA
ncbi:hypothetical protein MRS74_09900 [Marinobacterium sp. OS208]|nr:hypothetical protein [Marinobacterium sedimentorum]MCP8687872.1 hypothetical protein [Marinobacterium sedimentorum]